jgi:transposase
LGNLQALNAILYVGTSGCRWAALLQRYGNWHTIYMCMVRWSHNGVLNRLFEQLPRRHLYRCASKRSICTVLSSKCIPMALALQKNGPQAIGRIRSGWSTKMHMVAADARSVLTWSLRAGQAGDTLQGRQLIEALDLHQIARSAGWWVIE